MTTSSTLAAARSRYTGNAVATASGPALLVMLYDRLVRDLVTAEEALDARQVAKANSELQHAQQIILELRSSLDVDAWSGGPVLRDLYTYTHAQLVDANLEKRSEKVLVCRQLLEPLRDAWRQAAADASAAS